MVIFWPFKNELPEDDSVTFETCSLIWINNYHVANKRCEDGNTNNFLLEYKHNRMHNIKILHAYLQ
jgi:hypothetical protein